MELEDRRGDRTPDQAIGAGDDVAFVALRVDPEQPRPVRGDEAPLDERVQRQLLDAHELDVGALLDHPARHLELVPTRLLRRDPQLGRPHLVGERDLRRSHAVREPVGLEVQPQEPHVPRLGLAGHAAGEAVATERRDGRGPDVRARVDELAAPRALAKPQRVEDGHGALEEAHLAARPLDEQRPPDVHVVGVHEEHPRRGLHRDERGVLGRSLEERFTRVRGHRAVIVAQRCR